MTSPGPQRLAPQTGRAITVAQGQTIHIISPEAEQVADVFAFCAQDPAERLSSGRTIDYGGGIFVTTGTILYSNRSNPMLTITEDTAGRHDFLLAPCSNEMFHKLYGTQGHHPSCYENIARSIAPFGIAPDLIDTTLNLFMWVDVDPQTGDISILPPSSRVQSRVCLRAETDLIVAITACSAAMSNNGTFKPIDVEIR